MIGWGFSVSILLFCGLVLGLLIALWIYVDRDLHLVQRSDRRSSQRPGNEAQQDS